MLSPILCVVSGVAIVALTGAPAADPVDARIDAVIVENMHPFVVEDGRLEGAGADFLLDEGAKASFFCVGEAHLTEQTPAFMRALFAPLSERGYAALAIETGERITDYAESHILDRPDTLRRLFAETPFSTVFIDHEPEFEMLGDAVRHGYDLWGLDQVFIGGARFNLDRLVELAPDAEALTLARQARQRAQDGLVYFMETGDQSRAFLISADEDDYAALRDAFEGVPDAQRIIDELEKSGRIYRLFGAGANYESNHERINLMKQHLAEGIRELPRGRKVLMKFGAMHCGRGYSQLNQLDVGNAASELGILRGGGSFHVVLTAGSQRGPEGSIIDFVRGAPHLQRFLDAMGDAEWAVFDLRPLRTIFHDESTEEGREALASSVWRYDAIAVTKQFTQASPLPGVPAPPDR